MTEQLANCRIPFAVVDGECLYHAGLRLTYNLIPDKVPGLQEALAVAFANSASSALGIDVAPQEDGDIALPRFQATSSYVTFDTFELALAKLRAAEWVHHRIEFELILEGPMGAVPDMQQTRALIDQHFPDDKPIDASEGRFTFAVPPSLTAVWFAGRLQAFARELAEVPHDPNF